MNDDINYYEEEYLKRFLSYVPIPKAMELYKLGHSARDRFFMAANRIGKTMACSIEVCMHATGNYPDWWPGYRFNRPVNIWVGGITEKEIDILQRRFFKGDIGFKGDFVGAPWIHPSLVVYENKTKHQYQITNKFGGTSQIIFKTYQQGRQTWQGEKLDICYLDEEPPMEIYTEASMRLMATSTSPHHRSMMLIAATCLHSSPFVQSFTEETIETEKEVNGQKIIDNKQIQRTEGQVKDGRVFILAGWEDASHLAQEEKEHIQSKIPLHEVEARTKGIPSVGSGMVYPISEQFITCEPFEIPKRFYTVIGMDFGFANNTALVFGALDKDKDIMYIYFEYAMNKKSPAEHLFLLDNMEGAAAYRWANIVHDPSGGISSISDGKKIAEMYRDLGLRMNSADNSRESGVLKVYDRLRDGRLKIFNTCPKLLSEYRMYARDDEGYARKGNDHLLAAMRYMAVSGISLARSEKEMLHDNLRARFPGHRPCGYYQ